MFRAFIVSLCFSLGVCPALADGVSAPIAISPIGGQGAAVKFPPVASGGCTPVLVLDCITTGIKAAYSTRKLLTSYAGAAIRVQNTTTNLQQDIGFVSNVLDTTSLTAFCTGADCVAVTWYDQSGNGNNLTQSATNAPGIYNNGTGIYFINSTRPALNFAPTTIRTLTNSSLAQNPVNTLFINFVGTLLSGVTVAPIGGTVVNNFEVQVTLSSVIQDVASSTAVLGDSTTPTVTASGSVIETQYNSSTGSGSFWVDGSAAGTFTTPHTFAGGGVFTLGSDPSGTSFPEFMGELVMYDLVGGIPSGSRTTIEANQKAYWGTP